MTARHLRNEAEYLPETLDELIALRRAVMAAGYSRAIADGLCGWVLAKASGDPDLTATNTRNGYRKILSDLKGRPHNEPGSGRPPADDDDAPIILVAGVTSSALREVIDAEVAAHRRSKAAKRGRRSRVRLLRG